MRVAFTRRTEEGGNLSLVVGEGDVAATRRAAVTSVNAEAERAVFMQQVHGGDVAIVDGSSAGRGLDRYTDAVAEVDGLVTTDVDLPLVMLVADCVPVVLIDPGKAVGAAHAGRGGVVAGVVGNAVAQMAPRDPAAMVALIGPAIGGCCYEVPQAMADEVSALWPAAKASTTSGTPSLDLPAAVASQLSSLGVGRIERVGSCTRCNAGVWFSHRAATAGDAPHGRQAAIVVRSSEEAPARSHQSPSLQSP